MRNFTSVKDAGDPVQLALDGISLKSSPFQENSLGKNKCLGLIFLNPSLRTRMSSQRAAMNLGMNTMVLNIDQEGWALEVRDGIKMDGTKVEHIREAAAIMGEYCEIIGVRSFAELKSKESDYHQDILQGMMEFSGVPIISLESALLHPLQSLADLMTIFENKKKGELNKSPKISLIWAPHVKPLPQAVGNSFAEWMLGAGMDLTIGVPEGFNLDPQFTMGAKITHQKEEAIRGADFIYVKNWSSFDSYGELGKGLDAWMLRKNELDQMNPLSKVMHCLPVRRDIELDSAILDSPYSLVKEQGLNRVFSAQIVLKRILESL